MLLQTLLLFGNTWCANSPLISRFMKGVFFKCPPKPRYMFTWDVSVVLTYLKGLVPLDKLTLKLLTLKVTALIALAAAPRAQTLQSMSLDFMLIQEDCVVFSFPYGLKTSRAGHQFLLKLEHFEDEDLCAMHTLLFYIKKTKSVRASQNVLVSYVTYKSVSTSSIARWLKCVLSSSGIDTDYFKAHSFRGASTSAAFSKGCSLANILATADWASDKNFKKFYLRHSYGKSTVSFTQSVFSTIS